MFGLFSSYNSRFRKDAVALAREFAISPGHGMFSVTNKDAPANPVLKHKSYSDGTTYLSLPGDRRVLYMNLVRDQDGGLKAEYSAVPRKDWIPIFFLPWVAGRMVKTTLFDKRPHPPDSPVGFITAAVNGCSVFVEGQRQTPTVYHANALGHNPNNRPTNQPSKALRRDRMDVMRQRVAAIPAPSRGDGGNLRGVEGRHYQHGFTRTPTADEQKGFDAVLQGKLGKKAVIGHGNVVSVREGGPAQVTIDPQYGYEGTVFGVRDKHGDWSFHYQKRVLMDVYTLKKGMDPALRSSWVGSSHCISSQVNEFWPAGGGVALARTSPLAAWPG